MVITMVYLHTLVKLKLCPLSVCMLYLVGLLCFNPLLPYLCLIALPIIENKVLKFPTMVELFLPAILSVLMPSLGAYVAGYGDACL